MQTASLKSVLYKSKFTCSTALGLATTSREVLLSKLVPSLLNLLFVFILFSPLNQPSLPHYFLPCGAKKSRVGQNPLSRKRPFQPSCSGVPVLPMFFPFLPFLSLLGQVRAETRNVMDSQSFPFISDHGPKNLDP